MRTSEERRARLETELENLEKLRGAEARAARLRGDEARLEAERLAAEAAVASGLAAGRPSWPVERAAALAAAWARVRELERRLHGPAYGREESAEAQLEAACDALQAWLDAPLAGGPRSRLSQVVLGLFTIAVIAAALLVHLAFLLLLVVLGPVALMLGSGQDARWRRMGARQRFEATRLPLPADWTETAVRARLSELEGELKALAPPAPGAGEPSLPETEAAEEPATAEALEEAREEASALALALGLVEPSEADRSWMETLARVQRARDALAGARAGREAAEREASAARESIFRFLARLGAEPEGGRADTETLARALERLELD